MLIPVTPDDFRLIGQRFASRDIVAAVDRLLPLGRADLTRLTEVEFDPDQLAALERWRAQLTGEDGDVAVKRGSKKASRQTELASISQAKRVLRTGIDVGLRALAARKPGRGESEEDTRRITHDLVARLNAVGGRVGYSSVMLRERLQQLSVLLGAAELAPAAAARAARGALVKRIDAAAKALPTLAETKKALQSAAKDQTAALDEVDGRAYWVLKQLCQAGRAYFTEQGDPGHAAQYTLGGLNSPNRAAVAPAAIPKPG